MRLNVILAALTVCLAPMATASAQEAALRVNDQLTVPQWVNPEVPGQLSGRLILPTTDGSSDPISEASLVMTNAAGDSVRATTNKDGEFTFEGVQPGIYALAARSAGIFACCAMHIVDPKMDSADIYPGSVEISAAAIDYTIIKTSIIRYLPPTSDELPYSLTEADLRGISARVVGDSNFRVLQTDGGLKGRIHIAGANGSRLGDARLLNIFLVAEGEVVDHVVSNNNGTFAFDNVDPGDYSILAIGESGLGMAGFELIDQNTLVASGTKQLSADGKTFVAQMGNCCCCAEFSMQLAPLPQAIQCMDVVTSEVVVQEPLAAGEVPGGAVDQFGNPIDPGFGGVDAFGNPIGGGFGGAAGGFGGGGTGGGFGGGGGGGFGGGLGGLASLAGLGLVGGLSGNNDGGGISPPGPATRSVPGL